jgi:hypothetical protein
MVTLTTGIMLLLFTCMHTWTWWIFRRCSAFAPTAYEVVRDCLKFEKHRITGYVTERLTLQAEWRRRHVDTASEVTVGKIHRTHQKRRNEDVRSGCSPWHRRWLRWCWRDLYKTTSLVSQAVVPTSKELLHCLTAKAGRDHGQQCLRTPNNVYTVSQFNVWQTFLTKICYLENSVRANILRSVAQRRTSKTTMVVH